MGYERDDGFFPRQLKKRRIPRKKTVKLKKWETGEIGIGGYEMSERQAKGAWALITLLDFARL